MEPAVCSSVGFVLEKTRKYITLCMTKSDDQVFGRTTIPTQAILSLRKLR